MKIYIKQWHVLLHKAPSNANLQKVHAIYQHQECIKRADVKQSLRLLFRISYSALQ
jgi:hypothetical protein